MKPGKFKEMISHIFPIQVETCSSSCNNFLEVMFSKGRYVLNSSNTNYSFGGLHTIFEKTFEKIQINRLNISNCLLLGLGGGSVINLLQKKHKMLIPITAVEIDPVVIQLGNKYFDLNNYQNLSIEKNDAYNYVENCNVTYDLIIIDVYINNRVPKQFHSKEFVSNLQKITHNNTIILFNKMLDERGSEKEFANLVSEMTKVFGEVSYLAYFINGVENVIICVNTGRVTENQRIEENQNQYLRGSLFNPEFT